MRLPALLLCLFMGTAAWAQTSATSDVPLRAPPLPELEAGESLKVVLPQGALEGRLLESSARSLTLDLGVSGREREQVPLAEVLEISVRKRSVGYGTLIGTGAGILAGGILGLHECRFFTPPSFEQCELSAGAGALGGALLGAGLGALVGIFIPRWDRVYERTSHPLLAPP